MLRIGSRLIFTFALYSASCMAQCNAGFSFVAFNDSVQFQNTSSASNAHYYWNFGDGQTSYAASPGHQFPESGHYIVTLYVLDTITGCHSAKDSLIDLTAQSSDPCSPDLSYYYYTGPYYDLLRVNDNSSNCGGYNSYLNAGPAMNFSPNNSIYIDSSWMPANFIGSIRYSTHDSINGYSVRRSCYATMPYHYRSTQNYDSCSGNFEFSVSYQANGALLTFKAMDPAQTSFDFIITGMGNPVHLYSDNASYLMPYVSYEKYFPWLIGSYTQDANGCKDSCWQQVLIKDLSYVEPPSCEISSQPQNVMAEEGSDIAIITSVNSSAIKEWYMNDGTGFVLLNDAGKFSGTSTDTLHIHDVTYDMNNYKFKCVVSSNISGCHNTSDEATLTVEHADVLLYPNPAVSNINIVFTSDKDTSLINIYDIPGQKLFSTTVVGQSSMLNVSSLSQGCYFMEIITGERRFLKKFVVE